MKNLVIPAAGNGNRVSDFTQGMSKELLSLLGKPIIDYSIQESMDSKISHIYVIIRDEKIDLKNYLQSKYSFTINYIYQQIPKGLGDAILKVENMIDTEMFGVILPDDIIISDKPAILQLYDVADKYDTSVLGIEVVKEDDLEKYGIIKGDEIDEDLYLIKDIEEKPQKNAAFSNLGVIGRYILSSEIFSYLKKTRTSIKTGELELTDAIKSLIKREDVYAVKINGTRYDCGNVEGYLKAVRELEGDKT